MSTDHASGSAGTTTLVMVAGCGQGFALHLWSRARPREESEHLAPSSRVHTRSAPCRTFGWISGLTKNSCSFSMRGCLRVVSRDRLIACHALHASQAIHATRIVFDGIEVLLACSTTRAERRSSNLIRDC